GLNSEFSEKEQSLLNEFKIVNILNSEKLKEKVSIDLGAQELCELNSTQKLGFFAQKLIGLFDQSKKLKNLPGEVHCLISVNATFFEMISYISCLRSLFKRITTFYQFEVSPGLTLWSIPDFKMQNKVFVEGNHLKNLYAGLAAKLAGVDHVVAKNYHYPSKEKVFSTDLLAYINLCLLDEEGGVAHIKTNITKGATLIESYQQVMMKQVWKEFIAIGREEFLSKEQWNELGRSSEKEKKEKTIVGVNAFESKLFEEAGFLNRGESNE
ncbi:hypothetical protein N9N67_09560, partial [Bacteriovoracaceae bacterium]|nr:hypothetical protein [Bacteriovoracaceae bacterium]